MRSRNLSLLMATFFVLFATAIAQTSWLDRPRSRNWNNADGNVPQAPRVFAPIPVMCREQIRTPETLADRAVTRAGWSLFGPVQSYGPTTVVMAMASVDGMCRPNQYNGFVFARDRFIGTLAPEPMMSRTDGALGDIRLINSTQMTADFARYTDRDALCCPSQKSIVTYSLFSAGRAIVSADEVQTVRECRDDGPVQTQDNVVSGTVTYRQRLALPQTAVLSITLVDVSRQDTTGAVIAEDRIDLAGKQVPISFDLAYERRRIQERNRYVIRAEIRDGDRLLFTTDTNHPVITQGNPRNVDITLVQVGGGGGQRENVIRGTVSYRQRVAMPPNAQVFVRLVESGNTIGGLVAESTVSVLNRQVPIAFELPYAMRDINRQRSYELQAEIRSGGQVRFRSAAGVPVTPRGIAIEDIEIIVVPAGDDIEPITGRTLDLSKIGVGSMQIGTGSTTVLVRTTVVIRSNGDATVTLNRLGGSVTFTGKLTYFDSNSLRITAQNSGNADASGEIEVTYRGNVLSSITSRNLVMDGQDVTIRF